MYPIVGKRLVLVAGIGLLMLLAVVLRPSGRAMSQQDQEPVPAGGLAQELLRGYASPARVAPEVMTALAFDSPVSVIVTLASETELSEIVSPIVLLDLVAAVEASASDVLSAVPESEFELDHQYQAVPALAGDVTEDGVAALVVQPGVVHVALDRELQIDLAEATALIRADDARNILGATGEGVVVAVLDTGIDTDHPLLSDDINHQECFLSVPCPGGGNVAEDGHGHGSHVSGIITSAGPPFGIAPDALIDVFKVIDDSGSLFFSNVLEAYDEIILNHPEIDLINMSFGDSASHAPGSCESFIPAFTTAIATTRAMGITSFASSGNIGAKSGIGYPACLNDVVSVGAVYDADVGPRAWFICNDETTAADQVVCFSQGDKLLGLLAPGSTITSTVIGGGLATLSGTSMASPAAAAVAALLLESEPLLTPAQVEARLSETGVPVLDHRNGVTTCRVDAYEAVIDDGGVVCTSSAPPAPANDDFVNAVVIPVSLPYSNKELTTSATTEPGEPSTCASIASTVWYKFTPASDLAVIADTFGSRYDTVLAVHIGPSVDALTPVACNDQFLGNQSRVSFNASAGVTYHFQVGGYFGSAANLVFNLAIAPPCPPEGCSDSEMLLNIKGGDCDDPARPRECDVRINSKFTLSVDMVVAPKIGYILAQSWVEFGSKLLYNPTAAHIDEIVWPDCFEPLSIRFQINDRTVNHGCISGHPAFGSIPISHYIGNFAEFSLTCSPNESSSLVELLPEGDPRAGTSGSLFLFDPDTRFVPRVSNLTINCVEPPKPVGGVVLNPDMRGLSANGSGAFSWTGAIYLWAAVTLLLVVPPLTVLMLRGKDKPSSSSR